MVLVSTAPQKDKNGNPVATTQPTVLAQISGTSQPVALPLSVVTALQAQAKLQQQQQQQSTTGSVSQQSLKTFITNKTTVCTTVANAASQQTSTTTVSTPAGNVTDVKLSSAQVHVSSAMQPQPPATIPTQVQQSPRKPVDPKLLQQLLLQQGKLTVGPAVVAVSQASGTTAPVSAGNPTRSQIYHYNNIAKLPPNVVQQLIKTNSPQQIIRVRPPAATVAHVTVQNSVIATTSGDGKVEPVTLQSPSGNTALTNLIQAGLMPQAPKVTSFVTSPQISSTVPLTNTQVNSPVSSGKPATVLNSSSANDASVGSRNESTSSIANTTTPSTHIVTVTVSPSGAITSTPNKATQQAKMISPELIAKLEAQGVSAGKQPNIAAMIQANPGLFKSLSSPPKQKYASNVTVKSLLEKRALEVLRQKQTDGPNGQVEGAACSVVNVPSETEIQGNKVMVPETSQITTVSKGVPLPVKPFVNLSPGIRLQNPRSTPGRSVPLTQVIQGGAIRKIQLTPQVVQQPSANSQVPTVTVNPSANVLNIQQNLTPQQLQLLRQQLVAKFDAQNIPQNIQIVQQVPAQQGDVAPQTPAQAAQSQVQTSQTMKQIKVPTGTVTIQPKVLVTGNVKNVAPKDTSQGNESVIDNALKTVMTTVQTSLPTAQIKVSSPFAASTRNVTITASAMKSPIPAVPPVEAMSTSPTKTVQVKVIDNTFSSTTATPTVTATSLANPSSNIINTAGANAIKIIPDASVTSVKSTNIVQAQQQVATPQTAMIQGLGVQENVVVQMKPKGVQGVVVTQGMLQQVSNTFTTNKPITIKQPPQTVHNLLLQQKNGAGKVQVVSVSDASSNMAPASVSTASIAVTVSQAVNIGAATGMINTVKTPLTKGGGKVPLSPKTKISSVPYVKPQTIQQIIESKAKASNANKQMKPPLTPVAQNKQTVVMPGTVPGASVRIIQASTALASSPQVAATTASPATCNTAILSPTAGSTMTNVMANIGGKMVQLRIAVAPGQNINQILQSPQLQQQLQQLQQSALPTGGGKVLTGQAGVSVQQSQPTVQVTPQRQTSPAAVASVANANVVKPESKTIRALTNMNQNQQSANVTSLGQPGATKPVFNTKIPPAPQILSAKTAAPRATITVNQNILGNPNVPVAQTRPSMLLSTDTSVSPQNPSGTVQQVGAANVGQGKVVLVNIGGQIMAAQTVGGRTVLTPQGVNIVGQNVTGLAQNIPAQIIANVQPKMVTTTQPVGTLGMQQIQTQQIVVNGQDPTSSAGETLNDQVKTEQVSVQQNFVNHVALSNANVSLQSSFVPMSPTVPIGSLMMVGSGLMPVPTTQPTCLSNPKEAGNIVQVSQPLSPTFRHNMPQQIQISRQTLAMAAPQVAAAPQASPTVAVAGGLEQLALAAAQVQEAMQHQQTGTPQKSAGITNIGSNQSQANTCNNAQTSNEYAALPSGTSLP